MTNKTLAERCHINTNFDEDTFVGVKIIDNDITVNFPIGYEKPSEDTDESTMRREILSLLVALSKFTKTSKNETADNRKTDELSEFPIQSYQFIINDFLINGYYVEKEIVYKEDSKGKINWKRTIQQESPQVSGNNIVYLKFITKKNNIKVNSLITRIHEYCVYESFCKLGWLYSAFLPKKPTIPFNKNAFITVLNDELGKTFNDNKRALFKAMINVIKGIDDSSVEAKTDFVFGTNRFEYAWESMIDYVFGEDNKQIYFPKAQWHLVSGKEYDSSELEPDTIIKLDNRIYIIDAKYYKYGITYIPSHLPATSSIQKQITYGEYLENEKSVAPTRRTAPYDCIYNAFVMPFNKNRYGDKNYKFIGNANAEWKDDNKPYECVLGILMDTKFIISSYTKHKMTEINNLTALIEESFEQVNKS